MNILLLHNKIFCCNIMRRIRSLWPRGLRRGSATACLLGVRVRIPPAAWMSVPCDCCVLSGRCRCDGPITRPEKPNRVCTCVTEYSETQRHNTYTYKIQWTNSPMPRTFFWLRCIHGTRVADGAHHASKHSPLTFNHLSLIGTKACILAVKK
jgi:hypothetical protein